MGASKEIINQMLYGKTILVPEDLNFKGSYDASGGACPTPAVKGDYYVISVSGVLPLGAVDTNEWIWYDGTNWSWSPEKLIGVSLVNGQSGNVTLDADDIDDTLTTNKFVSSADKISWNAKLDPNAPITGATKTKITYDADGLVIAGADATTGDIADSLNKRYVTDAEKIVIENTSNTNSGDETKASIEEKLTGNITTHTHSVYEPANANITKQGNTFNGVSQLVQTDANGKLPAIDGSNLTNLPSGFADPMTTRGDIIYRNASNVTDNLSLGTVGQVLKSDGTDLTWGSLSTTDVGLGNVPNTDATNPANITQSENYRFVTDTEKGTWNGKQDALGFTPENASNKATNFSTSNDTLYPSVKAVKDYADGLVVGLSAETTTTIGTLINGATEKTTPVGADMFALMDSEASNVVKKFSITNLGTYLKGLFVSLTQASTIIDNSNTANTLKVYNSNSGTIAEGRVAVFDQTNSTSLSMSVPSTGNTQSNFFGVARSAGAFIFSSVARNLYLGTTAAYDLIFGTNNTARAKITSAGKFYVEDLKSTTSHPTNYKSVYIDTDTGLMYTQTASSGGIAEDQAILASQIFS